jgi:hypothetical protein
MQNRITKEITAKLTEFNFSENLNSQTIENKKAKHFCLAFFL